MPVFNFASSLLIGAALLLLDDDHAPAPAARSRRSPEARAFIGAELSRLAASGIPRPERMAAALRAARAAGFSV